MLHGSNWPNPACRTSAGHHAITLALSVTVWGLLALAVHLVARAIG